MERPKISRVLTFRDLREIYNHPWSDKHTMDKVEEGLFPAPRYYGPQTRVWDEHEYLNWREQLPLVKIIPEHIHERCVASGKKGMASRWGKRKAS